MKQGLHSMSIFAMRACGDSGGVYAGDELPKSATTGAPTAAAACMSPESLLTTTAADDSRSIAVPRSVLPVRSRIERAESPDALITASAGALIIADDHGWRASYMTMAALMLVGVITTMMAIEPARLVTEVAVHREQRVIDWVAKRSHWPAWMQKTGSWFIGAVAGPVVDFFGRYGLGLGLLDQREARTRKRCRGRHRAPDGPLRAGLRHLHHLRRRRRCTKRHVGDGQHRGIALGGGRLAR